MTDYMAITIWAMTIWAITIWAITTRVHRAITIYNHNCIATAQQNSPIWAVTICFITIWTIIV